MSKFIDLTGQRFGKLLVLYLSDNRKGRKYWMCQCDCGNYKEINGQHMKSGKIVSCRCQRKENIVLAVTKHNLVGHPIYRIWRAMRQRCLDVKASNYHSYGGRGIKICEEWVNIDTGAINFYNWSMENGWEEGLTIERIDVNGNYCPENCTWATKAAQQRNKTDSIFVTIDGEYLCLSEAVKRYGKVSYDWARERLNAGWPPELAITMPPTGSLILKSDGSPEGSPLIDTRNCVHCNKEFMPVQHTQKFCGKKCRICVSNREHKKRKKSDSLPEAS